MNSQFVLGKFPLKTSNGPSLKMWIFSGEILGMLHGTFSDIFQRTAMLCNTGKNLNDEITYY
jgi:hypothetical protein